MTRTVPVTREMAHAARADGPDQPTRTVSEAPATLRHRDGNAGTVRRLPALMVFKAESGRAPANHVAGRRAPADQVVCNEFFFRLLTITENIKPLYGCFPDNHRITLGSVGGRNSLGDSEINRKP